MPITRFKIKIAKNLRGTLDYLYFYKSIYFYVKNFQSKMDHSEHE